jgi:predicted ATPase/DNA-binding winged helix-turn-helix (wHTH) protein
MSRQQVFRSEEARSGTPDTQSLTFGTFRLLPEQHALFEGSQLVRLGSRALEILLALVARAGELVTKEELFRLVWPDTAVEENNLRVHIAALRKVLGDGQADARYIENVPGRGYRFVGVLEKGRAAPEGTHEGAQPLSDLPASLVRLIGRAELVQSLSAQLLRWRLITIVAPGGVGKTTVALAVAEAVARRYADGVRFVDCASLADSGSVSGAVASALSLPVAPEHRLEKLRAFLADKELLFVLDNCEHVAGAIADLVEGVLRAAPKVHVLVTSRERLQAQGERVMRLPALEFPQASPTLSAKTALTFPAVQLFVERASEDLSKLSDADARIVTDICRRVDGNPLAIELAASRVAIFGVQGLALQLDARFSLLMKGRRTALGRHSTLLATLDWSYNTLSKCERIVLRRLAIFRGSFTVESAVAVASDTDISVSDVFEGVIGLASKSLLAADASGRSMRYRLLEITREYAAEKLMHSGERERLVRRHAEHFRDLVAHAEQQLKAQAPEDWMAVYRWQMDDVRIALDWAFAPGGDTSVGVALTVSSVPLWFQASLMHEYRAHVEKALERVKAESPSDPIREMKLSVALGPLLMHSNGPIEKMGQLVDRALELSNGLAAPLRMQAFGASWVEAIGRGDYPAALRAAEQFGQACSESPDASSRLVHDRMMALALHFAGEHQAAQEHALRVLGQLPDLKLAYNAMSYVDHQVSMQTLLARTNWLQGFPDQAMATIRACIQRAIALNHATSLCYALAIGACPIAFWCGNLEAARSWVDMLVGEARGHSLEWWGTWGRAFEQVFELRAGHATSASRRMPRAPAVGAKQADALATLSEEPLEDDTLGRAERGSIGWCAAEVIRVHGSLLLKEGRDGCEQAAETLFQRSRELAARQGALSWELRSALSLAELWLRGTLAFEARALVSDVVERFTEGFATADLTKARMLLETLDSRACASPLGGANPTISIA